MEIRALSKEYRIVCAGLGHVKSNTFEYIDMKPLLEDQKVPVKFHRHYPIFLRRVVSGFIRIIYRRRIRGNQVPDGITRIPKRLLKKLEKSKPDLILAHDITILPWVLYLAKEIMPVVLNAHEYYPQLADENPDWVRDSKAIVEEICRTKLKKLSGLITVSEGIAMKYKSEYDVDSIVITNAKRFYDLSPKPALPESISIVHHGLAARNRKIEEMAGIIDYLPDNFTLDFMLLPLGDGYLEELKHKFSKESRIRFLPVVPTEEIPNALNHYDIGLFMLPPVNFNYEYSLPNKLFEFIQARLAIAIGPSFEMKKYVKRYDLGIVTQDYSSLEMAANLRSLTIEKINYYKNQSHKFARELSSEGEEDKLQKYIRELIR